MTGHSTEILVCSSQEKGGETRSEGRIIASHGMSFCRIFAINLLFPLCGWKRETFVIQSKAREYRQTDEFLRSLSVANSNLEKGSVGQHTGEPVLAKALPTSAVAATTTETRESHSF